MERMATACSNLTPPEKWPSEARRACRSTHGYACGIPRPAEVTPVLSTKATKAFEFEVRLCRIHCLRAFEDCVGLGRHRSLHGDRAWALGLFALLAWPCLLTVLGFRVQCLAT